MNWGIQLSYYLWRKHQDKHAFAGQKTLLNYYTGYLGDGIIVPLINTLIFYVIYKIGTNINWTLILSMFSCGLVLDVLAHYFQGKFKLTNWSMPKPFSWNFAGYWHMVSFPIQMGYIMFFFWIVAGNLSLALSRWEILAASVGILSLMVFFCFLYGKDNHWI